MSNNKEIAEGRIILKQGIEHYANAPTNKTYSLADFRITYNVSDDDWEYLKTNCQESVNLIERKSKLNLRVRLLDPEIKAAEVHAIRAYLELEEGQQQNATHTYNIQFAKTAEDMANIILEKNDTNKN